MWCEKTMLKGCAGSEGKGMESQRFSLPLGLPRATRIPPTCGWRGCRTWQGSTPRGATTPSPPSAWCTLQPWWPSTWACWRTGNTSLWAVLHFRWGLSSPRDFWGLLLKYKVSPCAGCPCAYILNRAHSVAWMKCCSVRIEMCILYTCSRKIDVFYIYIYTHYKNRNILRIYSVKIESYLLHIYSLKIESHL